MSSFSVHSVSAPLGHIVWVSGGICLLGEDRESKGAMGGVLPEEYAVWAWHLPGSFETPSLRKSFGGYLVPCACVSTNSSLLVSSQSASPALSALFGQRHSNMLSLLSLSLPQQTPEPGTE